MGWPEEEGNVSKQGRVLRVATVYHNSVVRDRTFAGGEVTVGTGKENAVITPTEGIPEGFTLFSGGNGSFKLRVTDALSGQLHLGGETKPLKAWFGNKAREAGSVEVEVEGKSRTAKLYEVEVTEGDWGVVKVGEVELVFQFVLPAAVIASVASFGGLSGAAASVVAFLFSFLGAAVLLAGLAMGGLLCYAFWQDTSPDLRSQNILLDERFVTMMTDVDETEEEEIVEEEQPDIEEAGKRAGGEEGKFGEEDPVDPETVLPDLDGPMVEKLDKPVGIQAAMSSNLLGAGGAQSLFGSGDTFGDAMDQVAMSGSGDAFNAGFGYGGMGSMGRGAGGGGTGPGRIGGLADKDTGGGRGSGKGLGTKAKAKVKPKVKFEAPKQEGFCKKENLQQVVTKQANALRNCYERQLLANPDLSGKIIVQWKVGLDGGVTDSYVKESTMKEEKVETCLTRVVKRMKFDPPDGGICVVEYPFSFSPSE